MGNANLIRMESTMLPNTPAETLFKAPRPDERLATTDNTFRLIVAAEVAERRGRTERLRQARLAASDAGS